MNSAVIAYGSNIEPEKNVPRSLDLLREKFEVIATTAPQKTKAVGIPGPDFLNGALLLRTDLDQKALKQTLLKMESSLGRVRSEDKNAPRPIDLDIVAFNGTIVDEDYHKYDFVREAVDELLRKES